MTLAGRTAEGIIFLSYRREDTSDVAGRIFDRLATTFGPEQVFKDVDSIPPGKDFRTYLVDAVRRCDVFLALIGPDFLGMTAGPSGASRLSSPTDFIHIELRAALEQQTWIVPLLVRGAAMPHPDHFPDALRDIAFLNAVHIRPDPDFHRDMDRLIAGIQAGRRKATAAFASTDREARDRDTARRDDTSEPAEIHRDTAPRHAPAVRERDFAWWWRALVLIYGCSQSVIVGLDLVSDLRTWQNPAADVKPLSHLARMILIGMSLMIASIAAQKRSAWLCIAASVVGGLLSASLLFVLPSTGADVFVLHVLVPIALLAGLQATMWRDRRKPAGQ